jgi:hypothetical protein
VNREFNGLDDLHLSCVIAVKKMEARRRVTMLQQRLVGLDASAARLGYNARSDGGSAP